MTEHECMALPWWKREKMLTAKDRAAIDLAKGQDWTEIDTFSAETVAGRVELKLIAQRRYHNDERAAGME